MERFGSRIEPGRIRKKSLRVALHFYSIKSGFRDKCIGSKRGPEGKCCGDFKGRPGPIAGDYTQFHEESYTHGCPVDELTTSTMKLAQMWGICDGDIHALFGCSLLDADNRTLEALKVLNAEAKKIKAANPPKVT